MQNIILNWSSGKDAALAYVHLLKDKTTKVSGLLTSLSQQFGRVSMHGTSEALLEAQASRMNLPLKKIYLPENADMEAYNAIMGTAVTELKSQGMDRMAFGDIFLEDLRSYREAQLSKAGVGAVFPLWNRTTADLVKEVEDLGIKAVLVCVNEKQLDRSFLGRTVNRALLADLPHDVDPCGENGEYHSLVIDAPYFSEPLNIVFGEVVHKSYAALSADGTSWDNGFYFLDVKADVS